MLSITHIFLAAKFEGLQTIMPKRVAGLGWVVIAGRFRHEFPLHLGIRLMISGLHNGFLMILLGVFKRVEMLI